MANRLVHRVILVPGYMFIYKIPEIGPGPPYTLDILIQIDFYIDDIITAVHGGPEQKRKVFGGTVWALKWLFLSFPGETKDSMSVKKIRTGEINRTCVKDLLVWTIDTEVGTVDLP